MGVPAFFRWLSKKYPSIIVDAVEEKQRDADGVRIPGDATQKNPNFQEFDNLYLDMNGIIHPCTHPEDRPAPKTEDEMFMLIFEYIDRLFSIVRPRRVLYMAIDGVAPRAKMNQQRSRRFRAAKEALEKKEEILKVRRKLESEGVPLPPPKKDEEHFDSNCITPGTPFMDRLAVALRYYVHKRISTDPAWQYIQVILSDANVPGEGEHKIMDYIRRQRASSSHDPNTVHCLCGADADLIMLGLATHEANFNILREEFVPNQPRACELCGQYGHELKDCKGLAQAEKSQDQADPLKKEKNFIFIRLPVLREYLERELAMPNLPFTYDFERAVDDWVFMCFFVGNDFLPHLPSLEIRENAIDRLIKLYKNVVYTTKGWLTKFGDVYLDRVEKIMIELGKVEDEIFKTRQIKEMRYKQSRKNSGQRDAGGGFSYQRGHIQPSRSYNRNDPPPRPYDRSQHSYGGGQAVDGNQGKSSSVLSGNSFSALALPFVPGQTRHANDGTSTSSNYGAPSSLLSEKMSNAPQLPNVDTDEVIVVEKLADDKDVLSVKSEAAVKSEADSSVNEATTDDKHDKPEGVYVTPKGGPAFVPENASLINPVTSAPRYMSGAETRKRAAEDRMVEMRRCEEASARLKAMLLPVGSKRPASSTADSPHQSEPPAKSFKEIATSKPISKPNNDANEEYDEPHDGIRLWEIGWKERYYQAKFGVSESDIEFRHKVAWAYAEGLCWVLKYYYQGCASWNWYFPYHYAPFASDFDTISQFKPDFSKPTAPFKPLEQLMGVFPAASLAHIPETWRWLMTDEESPIFDFYPKDFDIDLNGKKYAWQGVALLPFVDERRLLDALKSVYPKLTAEEQRRNDRGPDRLFVGKQHPLFSSLMEVYNMGKTENGEWKKNENGSRQWAIVDHSSSNGMSGEVSWDKDAVKPETHYESLFNNSLEFDDIHKNTCIMVVYRDPQFPDGFVFDACRLDGVNEPDRVLKLGDWDSRRSGDFKPQIGFSRDIPQARLSSASQRLLNHAISYQNGAPLQPLSASAGCPSYHNSNSPNKAWRPPYPPMHERGPPPIQQQYGYNHMPRTAQGYGNRPMHYGAHYSDPPQPRSYQDRQHHQPYHRQPPYHQQSQGGGRGGLRHSHYQPYNQHHQGGGPYSQHNQRSTPHGQGRGPLHQPPNSGGNAGRRNGRQN